MVQNKRDLEYEIILVLLKDNAHLREISRILNESHSTILRKINNLIEKNILDCKKEGRNKIFFIKTNLKAKNYAYSAEIYRLNKLLEKDPRLSIIFEEIRKKFPKGMIILFGSYAKGSQKKDSDIDVYLETKQGKIKEEIKGINSKLSIKIGEFDINSLLVKEIIKNHVIIRGAEDFYEKVGFFKET